MQAQTTLLARWLLAAAALLAAPAARAQDRPYPAGANVVNVKLPPYNAVGDGVADDTNAIQQAITDYVDTGRIVYLPNGTYLISNRLLWPYSPRTGQSPRFMMVHGQSQTGAVIKLKNNCPGFQNPAAPLALMRTTSGATLEQAFRNAVRDLTFDTGTGNPGAIGLQLFASNQGGAERVRIVSGDGQGVRGLDLGFDGGDGPAMFRDIYVRGFDYGVFCQYGYVMNIENLTVENQRVYGLQSEGGRTALRHFTSTNTVPALYMVNRGGLNNLVLLDSDLTGTGAASTRPAIRDNGYLYARNVRTSGYAQAIDRGGNASGTCPNVPAGLIAEYNSVCAYDKLSASPDGSLGLPIKDIPEVPWGNPATEWANVVDFGADPTGAQDATAAVQAAINSGKPTVYFPNGRRFRLSGTVEIKGAVRHVLGNECNLFGTGGFKLVNSGPTDAPVVVFEQFFEEYNNSVHLEQASTRTLAVNSVAGLRYDLNGSGDVFVNDVTTRFFSPNTAGASVWARQFNIEYATVENRGAKLWVLGMKTESESTWINTTLGGSTELLGCLVYSSGGQPTVPMFVNNESNVSLVSVVELNFSGRRYDVWVRETRGGTTRELRAGQLAAGDVMAYSGFLAAPPPPPLADGLYALAPECALATRLDVAGANTAPGTNVQIWTDNNSNAQKWQVARLPDGRYRLTSELNANRVLDVAGAGSAPGTNVHLWEWLDNPAQRWTLTPVANGYFTLTPQCAPGLRLDVAGASSAPGTNVAVWTDNGNAAQHWRFTPTTRSSVVTSTATAAAGDLALFPNPATGAVVLRAAAPLTGPVRLYNALGQLCRETPTTGQAETTLPLAGLPAGLYSVVAVDSGGQVLRRPLLVQ